MTVTVPINLAVEDPLSETVLRRIIEQEPKHRFAIGNCYCRGGYGYLKRTLQGFNNAAKGTPFLVLSDLQAPCPPIQVETWLPVPAHPNLLFRIAVKEVESWLLADRTGFASFLGVSKNLIPKNTDKIDHPKKYVIRLARKSRRRILREGIVPKANSTATIGPDYNGILSHFVNDIWNITEAVETSESLQRAVDAINKFQPKWGDE